MSYKSLKNNGLDMISQIVTLAGLRRDLLSCGDPAATRTHPRTVAFASATTQAGSKDNELSANVPTLVSGNVVGRTCVTGASRTDLGAHENHAMGTSATLSNITVLAVSIALSACQSRDKSMPEFSSATAMKVSAHHIDSAAVKSAEASLRSFFNASREGSATHDSLQTLTACGDDDGGSSYFPTTLLASYSLLPFDMRGDTVVARASVVTVAEQDVDRRTSRFTARQRVREDVLEWDVIPTDEPGHWVVCNGLRFGYLGADSLTTWRPDGASYRTARALVDSIVKARTGLLQTER